MSNLRGSCKIGYMDSLFDAIDVIVNIKPNMTIDTYTGEVQDRRLWSTSVYRTLNGDSRDRLCEYLEQTTNRLLSFIELHEEYCYLCVAKISGYQNGLRQIMRTYDDEGVSFKLSALIDRLDKVRFAFPSTKTTVHSTENTHYPTDRPTGLSYKTDSPRVVSYQVVDVSKNESRLEVPDPASVHFT